MLSRIATMMAIICVPSVSALGSVTYMTQERRVRVNSSAGTDEELAPDFGPFIASAMISANSVVGPASATQNSTLGADFISAVGSVLASDGNVSSGSSARSFLDVTFSIDQPSHFRLAAMWSSTGPAIVLPPIDPTALEIRLDDVRQTGWFGASGPFADSIDISGILSPGSHRLLIDFQWSVGVPGSYPTMNAGYNVMLTVPSPPVACASLGFLGFVFSSRRRRQSPLIRH